MRATLPLVFVATATAAVAVACSGGGAAGDDTTTTPTPTPSPVDACQIVWVSADADSSLRDVFLVDAPLADWTTGANSYAVTSPLGLYYRGKDPSNPAAFALSAAACTSGAFDLVLGNGTVTSASIAFNDSAPQTFFAFDESNAEIGAFVGTGGTGSFSGLWSNPQSPDPIPGSGTIEIHYLGTSLVLGGITSYATCYAHQSFTERTARTLSHWNRSDARPR